MDAGRAEAKKKGGLPFKANRTTLILLLGLVGIALIALSPLLKKAAQKKAAQQTASSTAESYAAELESRLESILSSTEGVGKVRVMITLAGGYSYEYALSESMNTDTQQSEKADAERKTQEKVTSSRDYILVDGSGGEQPVVTSVTDPEVKGVVVVCEGGNDPVVVGRVYVHSDFDTMKRLHFSSAENGSAAD